MRLARFRKALFTLCLGVVLYLIATNAGAGWLYVLSAAIGGMVAVSAAVPLWNVRGIRVSRRAPALATAGESFECELEIQNTGYLARHLLEIEDRFAGDAGRTVVVRVERGGSRTTRYTVERPCRGIYSGGEVVVESGAPFGLFYGRRRTRVASETVVYPRTFDVAELPPPVVTEAGQGDRSESSTLHRGYGGEFWGIREYRPGDPARLVAWKKSARNLASGKLAVVELARETHPPLKVSMHLDPHAPKEAREMVVSAGASLLLYGLEEGREVSADAGPQRSSFPEEATPDNILTWCAGLQPSQPPDAEGASVEIRPSTRRIEVRKPLASELSEAPAVVLVSCHEFAGSGGPWMSPEEENEFVRRTGADGRRVARLGPRVEEPWRIG